MKSFINSIFRKDRVVNLTLRGLTVLAKFLLSILIVKRLGVSELGTYGIFQTTITLLIFVLGFDFYTYNAREISKHELSSRSYLGNQALFHLIVYIVAIPISLLLFVYNVIDVGLLAFFYLILIAEHISQEIYRALIVFKKSEVASLVLFIRSGIWVYTLYFYWEFGGSGSLLMLFLFWGIAAALSIVTGMFFLPLKGDFHLEKDWIIRGFKVSLPFFIGTVFYKIIEFSGRYFLDYFWTKTEVGVFTFFSGISNTVFVMIQATIIIVISPYLLEAAVKGKSEFFIIFKKFRRQIMVGLSVGVALALIGIYPVLMFLDKSELTSQWMSYLLLLGATVFFTLSYIPHYKLYAFRSDRIILYSAVIGAVINITMNAILVPFFGVIGASLAQLMSMFVLFMSKWVMQKKIIMHETNKG